MDLKSLAIGIATRNRWEDLRLTLSIISNGPLSACPIYLVDDCSDSPCPEDLRRLVILERNVERVGYIVSRNRLAAQINKPYYLSLDDDSTISAGDVSLAIRYLEANPNVATLGFQIVNTNGALQLASLSDTPYRTKAFIGCGHIHRLATFQKLKGYREVLVHQGEEVDYGARVLLAGLEIRHFPGIEVTHRVSATARSSHRIIYYESRNKVLWNHWYLPLEHRWRWHFRTLVGRVCRLAETRETAAISGYLAGWQDLRNLDSSWKMPLKSETYALWRRLPTA